MEALFLAGRILFGGFFIASAFNHFMNLSAMEPYAASKGVPAPKLAVIGTGLLLLLGGLSIALGFRPTWGVVLLSLFLIPVSFLMHNFWADTDPQMKLNNQTNFMKNIALLGASWMFLLLPQPWPMSVTL